MEKRKTIPLYSRASDRSLSECTFRWHADQQGLAEAGASWYDIGHGMHETYEMGIERKWKTQRPYIQHAVRRVSELVNLGSTIMPEYLVSKHRPIDKTSLDALSTELAMSFYWNVVKHPPEWMPHVYEDGWLLEHNVQAQSSEWEFKAGASTTIDAFWPGVDGADPLLVDWKTGRSRRSDPRQLQFYRYLLELQGYEFGKTAQPWGAFFHAEHGTWQIVDEYDPQAVEQLIGSSQVLKQVRPEASPSWLCDYCTARSVCPAFAPDEYEAHLRTSIVEHGVGKYEFAIDPT